MRVITKDEMDEFIHQAVDRDYRESTDKTKTLFTRGHVFPNQYASNQDQADATFTFTNVAPQTNHSNGQWESKVETPMRNIIIKQCQPYVNPTHIVTGVVPGLEWIPIKRKKNNKLISIDKGVNIPTYYWTAFCCTKDKKETLSNAYLVRQNEPNNKTYELSEMSVDRLNAHLTRLYNQTFSVFSQWCVN